jgi:hypothetical protein
MKSFFTNTYLFFLIHCLIDTKVLPIFDFAVKMLDDENLALIDRNASTMLIK